MDVTSKLLYQPGSAQKARLVADQVRGLPVGKALDVLNFSVKRAASLVRKVLATAIADAEHNFGLDIDELRVSKICIDEGPTRKRWRARAKGRGCKIFKRSCHLTVVVSDK